MVASWIKHSKTLNGGLGPRAPTEARLTVACSSGPPGNWQDADRDRLLGKRHTCRSIRGRSVANCFQMELEETEKKSGVAV